MAGGALDDAVAGADGAELLRAEGGRGDRGGSGAGGAESSGDVSVRIKIKNYTYVRGSVL